MSSWLVFRRATCMTAMARGPWSMPASGAGGGKASGRPWCRRCSILSLPPLGSPSSTPPPPVTQHRTVLRELPQARHRPPTREASCRRDIAYVDHREFDTRHSGKANVIRNSDLTAPFLKYRADVLQVCIARLKGLQTGPRRMLWSKDGRERPPMPTSRSSTDCP